MKDIRFYFITLAFLFSFIRLSSAQNIEIEKAKNFRIEKLEGRELIISFTTNLENESNKTVGFTIKKGKLFKDGEYCGTLKLMDKVKLQKKSQEDVKVRLQVTLEKELNVMEEGLKALLGNPIQLKVSGKFKATWFIFWKKYPFEYQEKISLKNFLGN